MKYTGLNFEKKFGLFNEVWLPEVIAEMNDYKLSWRKFQVTLFGIRTWRHVSPIGM